MKESKFVEQNKKNWQEFENDLRHKLHKDKLSNLFIQVTDDLSYARTFYKSRSVKVYLNGIAQILFNNIYRNQWGTFKLFINFWKTDLPQQIHQARKEFRISFIIFLLAFGIGVLSSIYDKDFARFILGDDYINMTIENIKNSDPLAVYKQGNEAEMFLGITLNNLIVATATFVLGVFMSIGTMVALIRNGVMVGVFQYFFIDRGLFQESFLTIWQHGTIEISCIIIAGAAGMTLGKGLIFPGTYSRMESFKISALRGLKIFLGITPLIILAGFIEGFITRHTDVNIIIRLAVIGFSLCFILVYFVWYPWHLSRKQDYSIPKTEKLTFRKTTAFSFNTILSSPEILGYSLRFFQQNMVAFLLLIGGSALLHSIVTISYELFFNSHTNTIITQSLQSFFSMKSLGLHFALGTILLSFAQYKLSSQISRVLNLEPNREKNRPYIDEFLHLTSCITSSLLILLPFYVGIFWGILSIIFLSPIAFFLVYQGKAESQFFLSSKGSGFQLLGNAWGKLFINTAKIFAIVIVLYMLLNTSVGWQFFESIYLNFNFNPQAMNIIEMVIMTLVTVLLFAVYFYFQMITSIFSYYAFREIVFAENLSNRIDKFGIRNVLFGFEKEIRK